MICLNCSAEVEKLYAINEGEKPEVCNECLKTVQYEWSSEKEHGRAGL